MSGAHRCGGFTQGEEVFVPWGRGWRRGIIVYFIMPARVARVEVQQGSIRPRMLPRRTVPVSSLRKMGFYPAEPPP